jgi:hypothetical protein
VTVVFFTVVLSSPQVQVRKEGEKLERHAVATVFFAVTLRLAIHIYPVYLFVHDAVCDVRAVSRGRFV